MVHILLDVCLHARVYIADLLGVGAYATCIDAAQQNKGRQNQHYDHRQAIIQNGEEGHGCHELYACNGRLRHHDTNRIGDIIHILPYAVHHIARVHLRARSPAAIHHVREETVAQTILHIKLTLHLHA